MLSLICLVLAFVLFAISAFVVPVEPWWRRLLCMGLAAWVLAELIRGLPAIPIR